jgi:hypothetical protein
VIRCEQPRLHAIAVVQIVLTGYGDRWAHLAVFLGSGPSSPRNRM